MHPEQVVVLTADQWRKQIGEAYIEGVEGMLYALLGDAPAGDERVPSYDGPVPKELTDWATGVRARSQGVRANDFYV